MSPLGRPFTLLLVVPVLSACVYGSGPTFRDEFGLELTCYAPHGWTGEIVPAVGINGYANGSAAWANRTWYGQPRITFDTRRIRALDPPHSALLFLYYHECAHLRLGTTSELTASCEGLEHMRRDGFAGPAQEREIGEFHAELGDLGPQYGGTGEEHWQQTLECVEAR